MKTNKFIAIFTLFLVLFANFSLTAYSSDNGSNEPEPNPVPVLKLASDAMVSIAPNTEEIVEITIKNVSSFYAYNILVQAKATGENIPYTIEFIDKTNIKYNLQNGTAMKVKMRINVDKNAATGTYPIELSYAFTAKDKSGFTGSDTMLLRIDNDQKSPVVVLSNFKSSVSQIKSGETMTVSADLENIGELDARDLKISVDGLTAEGIGLADGSGNVYFKDYNSGFKNEIKFNFNANVNIKSGSYPVIFKLSYKDVNDKEYTKDYNYYINVSDTKTSDTNKADVSIISTSAPTGVYGVNQQFQVKLVLKNNGISTAKNIKISAQTGEDKAVVPHSSSVIQLHSLKQGETKELTFIFAPTSSSRSQNYSIGFDVEYETGVEKEDKTPEKLSFVQYVGVNVTNPEGDKKDEKDDEKDKKTTVPKIIVSKYQSDPLIVEAGKKFNLSMTFKNTHAVKTVSNIKLFLTVEDETEEKGNVFSPDNSSNTFYIASIPPNREVSHVFNMFTVPDAKPRTYTIKVNFQYEDAEANPYETTELVGVNVKQIAKLDTSEIMVSPSASVGEPVPVNFQLYNTGKVTLSNLMIKIISDNDQIDTSASTMFIGNMESGGSEYYEGSFTALNAGQFNGKILISYDDTNGDHIEKEQEFKVDVMEMPPMDENMEMLGPDGMPISPEGEQNSKFSFLKNKFVWIGASTALAVIVVVSLFIFKKIKKRREFDLNE